MGNSVNKIIDKSGDVANDSFKKCEELRAAYHNSKAKLDDAIMKHAEYYSGALIATFICTLILIIMFWHGDDSTQVYKWTVGFVGSIVSMLIMRKLIRFCLIRKYSPDYNINYIKYRYNMIPFCGTPEFFNR